jgi:mRNA interferase ChpB
MMRHPPVKKYGKKDFERGEIVHFDLDPTKGKEPRGRRYAIVISKKSFNKFGTTLVAPIIQGGNFARIQGFTVSLTGTGLNVQGVILVNQVRMLDLAARNAKKN